MTNISCIPPYWKDLIGYSSHINPCTSNHQLKNGYELDIQRRSADLIRTNEYSRYGNVGNVLDVLPPPCSEKTKISRIRLRSGRSLYLKFQYQNDKYWEIRNTRDFGIARLWSGVGGLVGIFLGFSFFQLVDIVLNKAFMFVNDTKLRDYQTKCM